MGNRSCCTTCAPQVPWRTSSSPRRCLPMTSRHGLGRGLDALLARAPEAASLVTELPIDAIAANPHQPRKDFDDAKLRELADSLRHSCVLQPVVVRKLGHGYQLVVGERRWRAARLAGLSHVPAIVRDVTDVQSLELAL